MHCEHFRLVALWVVEEAGVSSTLSDEEPLCSVEGLGTAKSAKGVFLQNGRICLYKYHWRCKSNPSIGVSCGIPAVSICWWSTLRRAIANSSVSEYSWTTTTPGFASLKWNLWYFRMLGMDFKNCCRNAVHW